MGTGNGQKGGKSRNVAPKDGRTKETQNERQDADRFAKQTNPAKQDVSQSSTGCALGMGGKGRRVGRGRRRCSAEGATYCSPG